MTIFLYSLQTAESDVAPLEIVQFHLQGWPDHGVPANAMSVVNFIKRVRKVHPYSSPKHLLVHCSAGVGRTGTFITLDSMLERIKEEQNVAIFPFVKHIRTQRVLMVQTLVSLQNARQLRIGTYNYNQGWHYYVQLNYEVGGGVAMIALSSV